MLLSRLRVSVPMTTSLLRKYGTEASPSTSALLRIGRLNHVAIATSQLAKATAMYRYFSRWHKSQVIVTHNSSFLLLSLLFASQGCFGCDSVCPSGPALAWSDHSLRRAWEHQDWAPLAPRQKLTHSGYYGLGPGTTLDRVWTSGLFFLNYGHLSHDFRNPAASELLTVFMDYYLLRRKGSKKILTSFFVLYGQKYNFRFISKFLKKI
jgi:hypothetical protein